MLQQPTVLVVEDRLGPRESLRAILQPDYRVLLAEEGEHALHLVEHAPVDVVLLDLRLPGLSGLHVLEKIKALRPSLAVIVVTGSDPDGLVPAELRLLIFEYIVKPFHVSHLRETVKRAVAQRSPYVQERSEEDYERHADQYRQARMEKYHAEKKAAAGKKSSQPENKPARVA